MDNVLIASNTNKTLLLLSDLLHEENIARFYAAQNSTQGKEYLTQADFDLVIIDSPLSDGNGLDLAIDAAEKTRAGIMLIVPPEDFSAMNGKAEEYGIFTLSHPIKPDFFYQAVRLLNASRKRMLKLQDDNQRLQKKIDETRIIDRAKLILVQVLKMTEPQAQRYIEKQSMDLRQSRIVTAENILRTYEN